MSNHGDYVATLEAMNKALEKQVKELEAERDGLVAGLRAARKQIQVVRQDDEEDPKTRRRCLGDAVQIIDHALMRGGGDE